MRFRQLLPLALFVLSACQAARVPGGGGAASPSGSSFDLIVLSTTDVHGRTRAFDYYTDSVETARGLTRAATIVDSIRAANPGRVLLVDAGDLLQGNPFAYVAMKQFADSANPVIATMNAMQYDAAAIGNHEYNYGVPYLERAVSQARFPMLSANTFKPDGSLKFKAWTMVERQGVKIGLIGATTPGVMVWDAENVKGRVTVSDILPGVRKAVGDAKAAGASIVIVTVHSGLNEPASYDTVTTGLPSENVAGRIASEIPGIDLVVYGHSHKEQPDLRIGSTLLVQPKNWATSVGVAHLTVNRVASAWRVSSSRGEVIQSRGHAESPEILSVTSNTHAATRAYANAVIGTTAVAWRGDSARLMDTPLIDFINEVERKAAGTDLASSAAFTLDASLPVGPITVARIAQLYPYDNTLRAVRITGKQLREYLDYSSRYYTRIQNGYPVTDREVPGYNFDIVSGADYTIDLTKPLGSRVTSLTFKGKPVTDTDTFTMALNNYRQTGGGGFAMLKDAPVIYDKQEEIRQLLIDEVQKRKTIKPDDFFVQNWRISYPQAPAMTGGKSGIAPGTPRLRIIATNDFHGSLEPKTDTAGVQWGGAAYTAAVIQQARKECSDNCTSILLDGGDEFQGTPVSNLAYGQPVVEYFNKIGYTASALGNHEFDWGVDTLRARMRQARYAILGANVKTTAGGSVPWIRADTIVVRGGTKVGVIGISTPVTATSTLPANVKGLRFDDPVPVINERARSLRARGADIVIVIAHEGGFCNRDAGSAACTGEIFKVAEGITEKVDAIVSGHTHSLVDTYVNGIAIVQARWGGQSVGVVDIPLNSDGKRAGEVVAEVRRVPVATTAPYAPVDSIVRKAVARFAPIVNRRYATLRVPMPRDGNQYALGNLVTDAQRWAGKGDIAIMNNRGIRAGLRAGEVNYGALYEIQPFANSLYRIKMTGAQVRQYLEKLIGGNSVEVHVSGVMIGYDPTKPSGQRIVSLTLPEGRTLVDNAFYDIVVNNFMATGGSNMGPPEGSRATPLDIEDLDALVRYIKTLPSPLVPPTDHRIFISQ